MSKSLIKFSSAIGLIMVGFQFTASARSAVAREQAMAASAVLSLQNSRRYDGRSIRQVSRPARRDTWAIRYVRATTK